MQSLSNFINEKLKISKINNNTIKVYDRMQLRKELLKAYDQETRILHANKIDTSNLKNLDITDCCRPLVLKDNFPEVIDVYGWDVSNITSLMFMFSDNVHLKQIIGLDSWDISNINDFWGMFNGCKRLEDIGVLNWDLTDKETNKMFNNVLNKDELISKAKIKL